MNRRNRSINSLNVAFSILIAFSAWFYVCYAVAPNVTRTYRNVEISYEGEYDLGIDGLGVLSTNIDTVDVTVTLPRTEVNKVSAESFKAVADVSTANKGANTVAINISGPRGVSIKSQSVDTVEVEVTESNNIDVDVAVGYLNAPDATTEPMATELGAERVSVMGAKELVDKVAYVVLPVEDTAIESESALTVSRTPVAVDSEGNQIPHVVVMPNSIRATVFKAHIKTVSLKVSVVDENSSSNKTYEVPSTIKIKGKQSVIKSITEVNARPINITDVNESKRIALELELPDGVEVANAARATELSVKISK